MKNKLNKILAFMLAIVIFASIGMTAANANNHGDTTFQFTFSGTTPRLTSPRAKMDDSNSYVLVQSSGTTFTARMYGKCGNSYVDCSNGYAYSASYGQARFMRNWVYEWGDIDGDGNRSAKMYGKKNGYSNVFGVWSPDSI